MVTSKGSFLSAIIFILSIFSLFIQTDARGNCIELSQFNPQSIFWGFMQPSGWNLLRSSGVTHYWAEDQHAPDGDITGTCASSSMWIKDAQLRQMANIMTPTQPSSLCQDMLKLILTVANFPKCDPKIDGIETGYVTREQNKPCKWLCDTLYDVDAQVCTQDDKEFLAAYGIDLNDILDPGLSTLQCNNSEIWSTSDVCYAPSTLESKLLAPSCQEYKSTQSLCRSIFPEGTLVYVPSGVSIDEIEQYTSFGQTLTSLPNDSKDQCASNNIRYLCTVIFPECVQQNVSRTITDNNSSKLDRQPFAVPLRTGTDTCHAYANTCKPTPFFSSPVVQQVFRFPDCDKYSSFRVQQCFPRGLTQLDANDYQGFEVTQGNDGDETDQTESDPTTKKYSMAQIKLINDINNTYDFNTGMFLSKYGYEHFNLLGPQTTKKQTILSGQVYAADTFSLPDKLPFTLTCPYPLAKVGEEEAQHAIFQGHCAVSCPSPSFDTHDHFVIELTSLIFVCISLLFALILTLTFLLFKSQRHKKLLFFYTLSYLGVPLFMFIGLMDRNGTRSTYFNQCDGIHLRTGRFGSFTAFCLTYFLIASSMWFLMMAIDLMQRLILGYTWRRGTQQYKHRQIAMHLFCWIVPLICCVAIITAGQFNYDGMLPFATIAQDPRALSRAIDLSTPFFFAPIILAVFVGFCCVAVILFFLIRQDPNEKLKKFADQMDDKTSTFWAKVTNAMKLFGFIFLVLFFVIILIVHQTNVTNNSDKWAESLRLWAEMYLITNDANTVPITHKMKVGDVILTVFGFSSPGFIMFLLYFVFSYDVVKLWCGLFYFKFNITFLKSWAKEDTITGSDGSSGGSSGSGSGSGGSNDIFTGMDKLTNRSGRNDTNNNSTHGSHNTTTMTDDETNAASLGTLSLTIPTVAGADNNNKNKNNKNMTSSAHEWGPQSTRSPSLSVAQRQEKRTALFKGFKNNSVVATSPTSPPSSRRGIDAQKDKLRSDIMSSNSEPAGPVIELHAYLPEGDESKDSDDLA